MDFFCKIAYFQFIWDSSKMIEHDWVKMCIRKKVAHGHPYFLLLFSLTLSTGPLYWPSLLTLLLKPTCFWKSAEDPVFPYPWTDKFRLIFLSSNGSLFCDIFWKKVGMGTEEGVMWYSTQMDPTSCPFSLPGILRHNIGYTHIFHQQQKVNNTKNS